jgi:hypothetical protein
MVFDGVAEYFFFYEFGARFNFIAIDYLIYTRELINNMKESYPLLPLFPGIALISFFILLSVRKWLVLPMEFTTFLLLSKITRSITKPFMPTWMTRWSSKI